jgi:hypothetical protein
MLLAVTMLKENHFQRDLENCYLLYSAGLPLRVWCVYNGGGWLDKYTLTIELVGIACIFNFFIK